MEIDRHDFGDASNDRIAAGKTPSIPRAISDRDDPFRIGSRMVGALQCLAHVPGHRPGYHQDVGMARRGDEAETEAFDVVVGIVERMDFEFASVARSGIDLAYGEASPELPPRGAPDGCGEFGHRSIVRRWRPFGERLAEQALKKQLAHLVLS